MKPQRTWILIADGAQGRILENEGPGKGLVAVQAMEYKPARKATSELGVERPGRVHDRQGPGRHAIAPRADWQRQEKQNFAAELARLLEDAAQRGSYERLILVAPPKALGDLRKALGRHARDRIYGELPKDLTHVSDHEIAPHLESVLVV